MKADTQGFLQLLPFPKKKLVHQNPPIYVVDDFLSQKECEYIIKISEPYVRKSRVVDKETGTGVEHPSRTSESYYHGYDIKWLVSRVQRITGVSKKNQEPTQVARYTNGQFYQQHLDSLTVPDYAGNRIATVLVYLNDVSKGGATFFNDLDLRVQPKRGSCVIFFPSKVDETADPRHLHTAENAEDIKWVTQVWVRSKPYSTH